MTALDPAEIILRIKSPSVPIKEVFDAMLVFFKQCTDDEGVVLLQLMRSHLDTDKHYMRMEELGMLGAQSKTYQHHMIRLFNYVEKQGIKLGDIPA